MTHTGTGRKGPNKGRGWAFLLLLLLRIFSSLSLRPSDSASSSTSSSLHLPSKWHSPSPWSELGWGMERGRVVEVEGVGLKEYETKPATSSTISKPECFPWPLRLQKRENVQNKWKDAMHHTANSIGSGVEEISPLKSADHSTFSWWIKVQLSK